MEHGTHLSVQQRIKEVAKHFTKCKYCFANWSQLNVILDEVEKDTPTICYVLPPSGTFDVSRGATQFVDKPFTQVAFLIATELDFDGEENDELVELMKLLAQMFVVAINESGLFDMIDDEEIVYQVPYDTADDNVTGVVVTLPIQENSRNLCRMPDMFGYVKDLNENDGSNE